jgi:hypothetical protein
MQPAADKFFQEIEIAVAGLLAEAFLDLPPHLPSKEAQGNAVGAVADKVPGQE